ncbi:MAG: VCBS repeat-containing protein [Anaerolineales bacterium]|nr:VCBS repeat-containing protein [Anaerolineales bacterium]
MLHKLLFHNRSLVLLVTLLAALTLFSGAAAPVYAAIHPQVMTSFTTPGGQVRGLAWGDNSLWLADDQTIYRLGAGGALQASYPITYSVTDMAWFENSLWVYADGGGVYKLNAAIQISETLPISYWCCHAMEWAQGYLYVTDYNAGSVHKHNRAGQPLSAWSFSPYMHPEGMTYDGASLWIGDSESRVVYRYSVTGTLQDQVDLSTLESCDYTCHTTLAWDGRYLWYAGKNTVYQLDLTGPFADANAGLAGVSGSAAAWGDYDGDGRLDLVVIGTAGAAPLTKLYHNDGQQAFTDSHAALPNLSRGSVDWGDYDNDGRLDLLLLGCGDAACSARVTRVYRNLGGGAFANVAAAGLPGLADGQAAWGDYNNDGRLDILLLGHNGSTGVTRIYRNNGNGTFTDIQQLTQGLYSGAVAWGDYDRDGRLDALVTGCYTATCYLTSLQIYHNAGGDKFDLAFSGGGARYSAVAWGDYNNDGYLDFLLTGSMGWAGAETCKTFIYRNDGGTGFTDIGTLLPGACHGSAAWGDFDNDGQLDLALAGETTPDGYNAQLTGLYHNAGNGDFTDIRASLKDVSGGAATWGDYDQDGRLDLLVTGSGVANIYHNGNAAPNAAPSAPNSLQAACAARDCTLAWTAPADDHTPAAGLSFNVRVGTTPGGSDVVAPMALANLGYRFVPRPGNAGERPSFSLRGLAPNTTYYWSVQAIDTAAAGSPFAVEGSFITSAQTFTYLPLVVKAAPPAANTLWSGTTSAGYPVSFEVTPNGQQWSNFKLKVGFQFGGCSGTSETVFSGPGVITNNTLAYSGSWSFTGQYTSPTSASGTYSIVNYYVAGCGGYLTQSGTWTVSRP